MQTKINHKGVCMLKINMIHQWFNKKLKHIASLDYYRICIVMCTYTMLTVTLILIAGHTTQGYDKVIEDYAPTQYEYVVAKEYLMADSLDMDEVSSENQSKELIDNALQGSTLEGMTCLAAEQLARVQEQEEEIITTLIATEERKTQKAREEQETLRNEEIENQLSIQKDKIVSSNEALISENQKKAEYAITLSSSERGWLEKIVQAESGNQDIKGRMLVANVVINRMKNKRYPSTVKGVVFQHKGSSYQFSPAKSGSIYRVKVTSLTKQAVERVLKGEDYSQGALFFVARSAANKRSLSWFDRKLTRLFRHGGHTFYR